MSKFNTRELTNLTAEEQSMVARLLGPTTPTPDNSLGAEQLFSYFKGLNDMRQSVGPQSLEQLSARGLIRKPPESLSEAV